MGSHYLQTIHLIAVDDMFPSLWPPDRHMANASGLSWQMGLLDFTGWVENVNRREKRLLFSGRVLTLVKPSPPVHLSRCEMVLVLKLIALATARQDAWQAKRGGKVKGPLPLSACIRS